MDEVLNGWHKYEMLQKMAELGINIDEYFQVPYFWTATDPAKPTIPEPQKQIEGRMNTDDKVKKAYEAVIESEAKSATLEKENKLLKDIIEIQKLELAQVRATMKIIQEKACKI